MHYRNQCEHNGLPKAVNYVSSTDSNLFSHLIYIFPVAKKHQVSFIKDIIRLKKYPLCKVIYILLHLGTAFITLFQILLQADLYYEFTKLRVLYSGQNNGKEYGQNG